MSRAVPHTRTCPAETYGVIFSFQGQAMENPLTVEKANAGGITPRGVPWGHARPVSVSRMCPEAPRVHIVCDFGK